MMYEDLAQTPCLPSLTKYNAELSRIMEVEY